MAANHTEFLQRANQARDKLSLQLFGLPDVSLVDLGYDPKDRERTGQIYLRVHVRPTADIEKLDIPSEVDSIPVIIIVATYRLE
jgi:hypothetical protein